MDNHTYLLFQLFRSTLDLLLRSIYICKLGNTPLQLSILRFDALELVFQIPGLRNLHSLILNRTVVENWHLP